MSITPSPVAGSWSNRDAQTPVGLPSPVLGRSNRVARESPTEIRRTDVAEAVSSPDGGDKRVPTAMPKYMMGAASTMRQLTGSNIGSLEASMSLATSPYPCVSREYTTNEYVNVSQVPETSTMARQRRFRQLKPFAKLFLLINCIIFFIEATVIFGQTMQYKLRPKSVWEMLPTPDYAEFDHFVIASTSETCNEYARQLWMESDDDVHLLSLTMAYCLSLLEPHNSGLGGQSIALQLDAKTNSCLQTRGHFALPEDLDTFVKETAKEAWMEHSGPYAMAIPRHIRTLRGLLQMSGDPKKYSLRLQRVAERMIWENDQFPISRSFHRGSRSNQLDLIMSLEKHYSYLLGPELTIKREGDRFRIPPSMYLQYVRIMFDNQTALMPEIFRRAGSEEKKVWSHLAISWEQYQGFAGDGRDVMNGTLVQIGDHTACVPSDPASASIVARAISSSSHHSDTMGEKTMMSREFYAEMADQMAKLYGLARRADSLTDVQKDSLTNLSIRQNRAKPIASYGANMFSLVDLKTQKATVMVATMGSSLGAMSFDAENRFPLNNFLSNLGKFYPVMGSNHYTLQPLIAMRNEKITVAWAGCGGFLTQSMDVARMMTSLTLNLLKKVPLYKAVTSPLFYLMPESVERLSIEYTKGIPWFPLKWLTQQSYGTKEKRMTWGSREDVEDEATNRIDRAVAVEVTGNKGRSFYFDGTNQRMMPNGF